MRTISPTFPVVMLTVVLMAGCIAPALTLEPINAESTVSATTGAADLTAVDEEGNTTIDTQVLNNALESLATADLSPIEAAGLRYMREEEKLAHDVYLPLYESWGLRIFQNIAQSEATHMDAMATLLDRYSIEDPAAGQAIGEFTDATLQALYDELTTAGAQSLAAALEVGATIEETDIVDLADYIAQTNNDEIILVYDNLMKGSRNHLRAFVSTYQRQTGNSYTPQSLDLDAFNAIIGSPTERGRG